MKTHNITLTIVAPNRLSGDDVAKIVTHLLWIGKEDAENAVKNGEGQVDEARDAKSLHLKDVSNK